MSHAVCRAERDQCSGRGYLGTELPAAATSMPRRAYNAAVDDLLLERRRVPVAAAAQLDHTLTAHPQTRPPG